MTATVPWDIIDTYRSIWEALAIVHGDDPDAAVEAHRRWCRKEGWELNADPE